MGAQTLIIQLARFGDLLQTKRLVKSLQEHSQVHLAVDRSLAVLAGTVYPEAVVHALDAHCLSSKNVYDLFTDNLRAIEGICANDYELIVNLNFSGLNYSLARLFDPEIITGYINIQGQDDRHAWTRLFFRLAAHRRLSALNIMDFWGHFAPRPISPDQVNPPASISGQGMGVVLAGKNARRSIPVSSLAVIALALREQNADPGIVLLGSEAEKPLARMFKDIAGPRAMGDIKDLTGRTSLQDLTDILSSLEMVLTPDTGTMHLAAHTGTRVAAFFISSAFCFETGPYGRGHTVFQVLPDCAPCLEARKCGFDLVCHEILKRRETMKSIWKGRDVEMDEAALFTSFFDDLGVYYSSGPGRDKSAVERKAIREMVRRYLGYHPEKIIIPDDIARIFYHERQWMLQ